jgi:hypothetical protein
MRHRQRQLCEQRRGRRSASQIVKNSIRSVASAAAVIATHGSSHASMSQIAAAGTMSGVQTVGSSG